MLESTIQTTFRSSDWRISVCDSCCQTDMWVVLLADERACNTCLQKFYDESGDKIITDDDLTFGNDWQPKHVAATILLFAPVAILFMLAMLLSNDEVAAFMRRLI